MKWEVQVSVHNVINMPEKPVCQLHSWTLSHSLIWSLQSTHAITSLSLLLFHATLQIHFLWIKYCYHKPLRYQIHSTFHLLTHIRLKSVLVNFTVSQIGTIWYIQWQWFFPQKRVDVLTQKTYWHILWKIEFYGRVKQGVADQFLWNFLCLTVQEYLRVENERGGSRTQPFEAHSQLFIK